MIIAKYTTRLHRVDECEVLGGHGGQPLGELGDHGELPGLGQGVTHQTDRGEAAGQETLKQITVGQGYELKKYFVAI